MIVQIVYILSLLMSSNTCTFVMSINVHDIHSSLAASAARYAFDFSMSEMTSDIPIHFCEMQAVVCIYACRLAISNCTRIIINRLTRTCSI